MPGYPCCCNKCRSYSDDEAPRSLTLAVAGIINAIMGACGHIENGGGPLDCTVLNKSYVADLADDNLGGGDICATTYEAEVAVQFCQITVTAAVTITITYARPTRARQIAVVIRWSQGIPFGWEKEVLGSLEETDQDPYTLADLDELEIPVTGHSSASVCSFAGATLRLSA